MIGARLLLLAEALGRAFIFARWGLLALYYYPLVGLGFYLLPTVALGVPALVIALKPPLHLGGGRIRLFLIANTLGVAVDVLLAMSRPDPLPEFLVVGALTLGATLLLVLAAYGPPTVVVRIALGGLPLLFGYAATYALPPTVTPALALHLEGVLNVPPTAHAVVRVPGGDDVIARLQFVKGADFDSSRQVGTVNPGTYHVGQACSSADALTWSMVQVSIGATVIAPDLCLPEGTLQGFVRTKFCTGATRSTCTVVPAAGQKLDLLLDSNGYNWQIITDRTGHYSMRLYADTYRLTDGTVLGTGLRTVVVQSRSTTNADIIFEP